MSRPVFFFAGSYTDPDFPAGEKGRGIALLAFDSESGRLETRGFTAGVPNPSYLALRPDGQVLYAVNELVGAGVLGRVSAFRVGDDLGLTALNDVSSKGEAPCHLSVDPSGRYLFVAHYTSGSTAVFPLGDDGTVAPATSVQQHEGSGPAPNQKSPHAHMVAVGPGGRFVYGADLGADTVSVAPWDPAGGLCPATLYRTARGAGPRHFVFSAAGDRLYVVCEIAGTIEVYSAEAETGGLALLQTISTLPPGEIRPAGCGTIRLSPSGRHLYVANRLGVDSLAVYAVDAETGLLRVLSWYPSGGASPRDFVLDPSGRFLLVANQSSGTVNVFRVAETGGLEDTGHSARVPLVTCLVALT